MPTENRTNNRNVTISSEPDVVNGDSLPRFFDEDDDLTEEPVLTVERGNGIESQITDGPITATFTEQSVQNALNELLQANLRTERDQYRWSIMDANSPTGISYKSYTKDVVKEYKSEDTVPLRNGGEAKFKDCVIAHGRFHLKDDKDITTDFYKPDVYINKDISVPLYNYFNADGIINTKKIDYFYNESREVNNNLIEIDDGNHHVRCDYDLLPKDFYKECFNSNKWYHNRIAKGNIVDKKQLKIKARKANCIYKASPNRNNLAKDYEMGVVSPTYIKTEGKRYLFGLEMETISGVLPQRVDSKLNYMSIRDGSLKDDDGNEYGFEYVTGVLTGDTGLLQLKKLNNELTKRCLVNKKCGVHVHLGGTEFDSELVVYLYKLSLMLEDQLFNIVPLSRRNNEYCRRLKRFRFDFSKEDFNNPSEYRAKIESYYNNIYTYVSAMSDLPSSKFNKKTQHPLGAKCGYNHSTARYCWMNFVPTIFDTRENGKKTIENRIMQGSTNFYKIKNWLLINMGILWFAENYKREIALNQEISLKYIMELAYPKTYEEINKYIDTRTDKFSSEDKDINSQVELNDYNEVVESEDLTIKNL